MWLPIVFGNLFDNDNERNTCFLKTSGVARLKFYVNSAFVIIGIAVSNPDTKQVRHAGSTAIVLQSLTPPDVIRSMPNSEYD